MVFVELPIFIRSASGLFSDEDLADMQNRLIRNPASGDLIPNSGGLRKLRVPLPGRGKRGGARVIYYYWTRAERCYLVYAYAKNVAADLTRAQLRQLVAMIDVEVKDG